MLCVMSDARKLYLLYHIDNKCQVKFAVIEYFAHVCYNNPV